MCKARETSSLIPVKVPMTPNGVPELRLPSNLLRENVRTRFIVSVGWGISCNVLTV